jgi:hypothetical protein
MRVWRRLTYGLIAICPYISLVCVGVYFFGFHAVQARQDFWENLVVEVGLPLANFSCGFIRRQFARHLGIRATTGSVLKKLKCQELIPDPFETLANSDS